MNRIGPMEPGPGTYRLVGGWTDNLAKPFIFCNFRNGWAIAGTRSSAWWPWEAFWASYGADDVRIEAVDT